MKFLVGRFGWSKFREAFSMIPAGNPKALEKIYGSPATGVEHARLSALASQ